MKFLKWIFLLLFLTTQTNSFSQTNSYVDSLALVRLYNSLGATLPVGPVDLWPGITTMPDLFLPDTLRVTEIALISQNPALTGFIPDSLMNGNSLEYLTKLDLSNNSLQGIIGQLRTDPTTSITDLTIRIPSNNLSISDKDIFIKMLKNLKVTSLSLDDAFAPGANRLDSYTIPTNELSYLGLRANEFTDTLYLDSIFTYCPFIQSLNVEDNNFIAIQCPPTPSSVLLHTLNIATNDLQNFKDIEFLINNLPLISNITAPSAMDTSVHALFELNLTNNNSTLYYLYLSENNLTGPIPIDLFEKFDAIVDIDISHNLLEGQFPIPFNASTGGGYSGESYYQGTDQLMNLSVSFNNLSGALPLDWITGRTLVDNTPQTGSTIPLTGLYANDNYFDQITPYLDQQICTLATDGSNNDRFFSLEMVAVENNELGFLDLFRITKYLNFVQIQSASLINHYVPFNLLDTASFTYQNQGVLGVGGVKRRLPNEDLLLFSDEGIVENYNLSPFYISNSYSWYRVDTAGIIGGTAAAPQTQFIGSITQQGASTNPNIVINPGLSATDTTYHLGVNGTADSAQLLYIVPMDSINHARWLYKAIITNDSFPLLQLNTIYKKVEVGGCFDNTGQPVNCQQMMVQFDPILLAGLSTYQQDSFKLAFRESLGAIPIESCLCGDIELWEISDTATAMLEGNSQGTKNAASTASAKPQLLSAGPNYKLLANSTSSNNNNTPLPTSGGNNTAKTLVAIIDSGLDYAYTPLHSHISAGLPIDTACIKDATWGYNFLDNNNNASDDHGHGTAVAGIVAGINKNNLLPNTGAFANKIAILPLKYTNSKGKGTVFNAACALRFAANFKRILPNSDTAKVRVINTSWGFSGEHSALLENALKYVADECNILVVASAGNSGHNVQGADSLRHWPSNSIFDPNDTIVADNILAVASLTTHTGDTLASYSNYSVQHIDIAALGIDSAAQMGTVNGFGLFEGTSFAAPQVARAAALLFDKYPDASYFAIKSALIKGVDILQHSDSLKVRSHGRLNYQKADSILNIMADRSLCFDYFPYISVDKIENAEDLVAIYPNPVSNQLNIDLDAKLLNKKININVFNTQGQRLYHQVLEQGSNNVNIPTQDFPVGVYFIQLNFDEQAISKKFLKI